MKAVLCKAYGPPENLVVEDIPAPEPGPGQVVVDVHAAAVNFPDVLMIQDKYQFRPPLPFSPGGEAAGVISALGEGVTDIGIGARVIASCGFGGFAESLAVGRDRVTLVPDSMDFVTAAAFLMTYGTSHHALKDRAQLRTGETLLVLGAAGGVGLAAVELGRAFGAHVIAAASSRDKLDVCKEHGAHDTIAYPAAALSRDQQKAFSAAIKDKTGGKGADVIYDPVGGSYAEPALRATNWEGRYLVIGFAAGDIPRIPLNLALLKGCQIVGVFWGAFTAHDPQRHRRNIDELLDMFAAGRIKPHVSATYPLKEAARALQDMAARKVKGKIVVTPRG